MKKPYFDERQVLARGQAYKYGFWAGILYFFLASIALTKQSLPFTAQDSVGYGVAIMVLVFLSVAIWKDAYFKVGAQYTVGGGVLLGLGIRSLIRSWHTSPFGVFMALGMIFLGTLILLRRILNRDE